MSDVDIAYNIAAIRESKQFIKNILLLGPPGHGKTAVANSIYRLLTCDTHRYPLPTSNGKKGTEYYKTIPGLPANIRIFDSPGFELTAVSVSKLLKGVREELTYLDGVGVVTKIDEKQPDKRNKINYVIIVLSAVVLEEGSTWLNPRVSISDKDLPPIIIKVIKEETGVEPFVLITHKGKMRCKEEDYKNNLEVSQSVVYFVDNYLKKGQRKNVATDDVLSEVLATISLNVDENYSRVGAERKNAEKKPKKDKRHSQSSSSTSKD